MDGRNLKALGPDEELKAMTAESRIGLQGQAPMGYPTKSGQY